MQSRFVLVLATAVLVGTFLGCRVLERGPSEEEVMVLVKEWPPSPPTVGPTYLAEIGGVEIEERGAYQARGQYWPVRVRVRGGARIEVTNAFQLGLLDGAARARTEPVEFVEEARFSKDGFGEWKVTYAYSPTPRWRLRESESPAPTLAPPQPPPG